MDVARLFAGADKYPFHLNTRAAANKIIFTGNMNGAIAHVSKTKNEVSRQKIAYFTSSAKSDRSTAGITQVSNTIAMNAYMWSSPRIAYEM